MKSVTGFVIPGLVLVMGIIPSWGDAPPNPTASDAHGNTAGGTDALANVDNMGTPGLGIDNTAFGFEALLSNTTGYSNTAVGWGALKNGDSVYNTATGAGALFWNTTGRHNTASGASAINSNTTGNFNTATGSTALYNNTTGDENTATGYRALYWNTAGYWNTATGYGALGFNGTGYFNTASGTQALSINTTGHSNTASGVHALSSNTTGDLNTGSGYNALYGNSIGTKNTAVGGNALSQSTGNQNIAVGHGAGLSLMSGNKNIYLGHPGASSESRTMRLGNVQTKTFIAGVTTAAVTGTNVVINASGQLGVPLSSARYKRDIETMGTRSEGVLTLRPVTYAYKDDKQSVRQYGLIAEEVATVYPELVTRTATGEVQAVRYQELVPMLVNELQRQQKVIERLEQQQQVTEHLQRELAELRSLVGQMRGGIAQR